MNASRNPSNSEKFASYINETLDQFKKQENKKFIVDQKAKKRYQAKFEDTLSPHSTIQSIFDELLQKKLLPNKFVLCQCIQTLNKKLKEHPNDISIILNLYQFAKHEGIINYDLINATIVALGKDALFHNIDRKEQILSLLNEAKQLHEESNTKRENRRFINKITYSVVIDAIGNCPHYDGKNKQIFDLYKDAKERNIYNYSTLENAIKTIRNSPIKDPEKTEYIKSLLNELKLYSDDTNDEQGKRCYFAIKAIESCAPYEEQQKNISIWIERAKKITTLRKKYRQEIYAVAIKALGNEPDNESKKEYILTLIDEAKKQNFSNLSILTEGINALAHYKTDKKQLQKIFDLIDQIRKEPNLNKITCTIMMTALGNCIHESCINDLKRMDTIYSLFNEAEKNLEYHLDEVFYNSFFSAMGKCPGHKIDILFNAFEKVKNNGCCNSNTINNILGAMASSAYDSNKIIYILNFFDKINQDFSDKITPIAYNHLFRALRSCTKALKNDTNHDNSKLPSTILFTFNTAIEKKCYNKSIFGLAINTLADYPFYKEKKETIQFIFNQAEQLKHDNIFTLNSMTMWLGKAENEEQLLEFLKKIAKKEADFNEFSYKNIMTALGHYNKCEEILKYLKKATEAGYKNASIYNHAMSALKKDPEKTINLFQEILTKSSTDGKKYYDEITFYLIFQTLHEYQCSTENDTKLSPINKNSSLTLLKEKRKAWYAQAHQEGLFPEPTLQDKTYWIDLHLHTFGSAYLYLKDLVLNKKYSPLGIIRGQELHRKIRYGTDDHGDVHQAIEAIVKECSNEIQSFEIDTTNLGRCYFKLRNTTLDDQKKYISKIMKVLNQFKNTNQCHLEHAKEYKCYDEKNFNKNRDKNNPYVVIFWVLNDLLKRGLLPEEDIFCRCIKELSQHTNDRSTIVALYECALKVNVINSYVINQTIQALGKHASSNDTSLYHVDNNIDYKKIILEIFETAKELKTKRQTMAGESHQCLDKASYNILIGAIANYPHHNREIKELYQEAKRFGVSNYSTLEMTLTVIEKSSKKNRDKKEHISFLLNELTWYYQNIDWLNTLPHYNKEKKLEKSKICSAAIQAIKSCAYYETQQEDILTWFKKVEKNQSSQKLYSITIAALGNEPNHKSTHVILELLNEAKTKDLCNVFIYNETIKAFGNCYPYEGQLKKILDLFAETKEKENYNKNTYMIFSTLITALGNCFYDSNRMEEILKKFEEAKTANLCDTVLYNILITAIGKWPNHTKNDLLRWFKEAQEKNCCNVITLNSVLGAMKNSSYYPGKEQDILNFFYENNQPSRYAISAKTYNSAFNALKSCCTKVKTLNMQMFDIHDYVVLIFNQAIEKKCYNEQTFAKAISILADHLPYANQKENIQLIFDEAKNKKCCDVSTYISMMHALRKNHSKAIALFEDILNQSSNDHKYYNEVTFHLAFQILYDYQALNEKNSLLAASLEKKENAWYKQACQEGLFPPPSEGRDRFDNKEYWINFHGYTEGSTYIHFKNLIKNFNFSDCKFKVIFGQEIHSKKNSSEAQDYSGIGKAIKVVIEECACWIEPSGLHPLNDGLYILKMKKNNNCLTKNTATMFSNPPQKSSQSNVPKNTLQQESYFCPANKK